PEFKLPGSKVVLLEPEYDGLLPKAESLLAVYETVEKLIREKKVLSAAAVSFGGLAELLTKQCLGNRVGFKAADDVTRDELFAYKYGSFVLELDGDVEAGRVIGETTGRYEFTVGGEVAS